MQPATLTTKQTRFIDEFLVDSNGAAAAVRAGYAPGSAKVAASRMLTKDNPVRRAIQARQDVDSERLGVSRDRVIAGFLEAFEMAKLSFNPAAMVASMAALAKLMGYQSPARVDVDVRAGDGLQRLEAMSNEELMSIVQQAE